jgi:hypothetical protein
MGFFLAEFPVVSGMAQDAARLEMGIFVQQGLIDHISFVHFFRPNWRRSTRSPLALTFGQNGRLVKGLHQRIIRMALNAFIGGSGKDRSAIKRKNPHGKEGKKECSSVFHNAS